MLTSSLMASLTVGALALTVPVPVATALAVTGDCAFHSVQNVGVLYGIAVDDTGAAVSIHCYVTVNGVAQPTASVSGSGTGVAVAAGPAVVVATPADDVDLCTQIKGGTPDCGDIESQFRADRAW